MKSIHVKRLFFLHILYLLWLPNHCDDAIKQEPATSDFSRAEDVSSRKEKKILQDSLGIPINRIPDPLVKFVNKLEKTNDLNAAAVSAKAPDLSRENKENQLPSSDADPIDSINSENNVSSSSTKLNDEAAPPLGKPPPIVKLPLSSGFEKPAIRMDEKPVLTAPKEPVRSAVEESAHQQYEGMPSFDEWKKMMLAEQGRGGQKIPSPALPGKKISSQKRRRNYASFECGAKIVASNAEAEGTSKILDERVDEYMLNPCKVKIWFVIELCEAVQATQLELANFELFSSLPKDFVIYSSDNFPTRDWIRLGSFTAQEQRVLQSYQLKQEGFGKFIKIELSSHYGKEHYCPLSVVRIFGTSMVDEYEEMETLSRHVDLLDDESDRLDILEDQKPTNIFGSATDAVMNIVKKAAQALGKQQDEKNDTVGEKMNASQADLCSVDETQEKCDNVTDIFLPPLGSLHHNLFQLLHRCENCISTQIRYHSLAQPQCRFLRAALGPSKFLALCNYFKAHPLTFICDPMANEATSRNKSPPPQVISVIAQENHTIFKSNDSSTVNDTDSENPTASDIQISKTIDSIEPTRVEVESSYIIPTEVSKPAEISEPIKPSTAEIVNEQTVTPQPEIPDQVPDIVPETSTGDFPTESFGEIEEMFESAVTTTTEDPNEIPTVTSILLDEKVSTQEFPDVRSQGGQKESVFMRMSNRIRALEVNMSLSGQYLQELSQRYRKQMDDMQRAFESTVQKLNDTARLAAEKDLKQQELLNALQSQLDNLTKMNEILIQERSKEYRQMFDTHFGMMIIEVIIVSTILSLCIRRIDGMASSTRETLQPQLVKRRSSVDSNCLAPAIAHKIRKLSSSEEVLNAAKDLQVMKQLHILPDPALKVKKKNRKRSKGGLYRSASMSGRPGISENLLEYPGKKNESHSENCITRDSHSKHKLHTNKPCENCSIGNSFVVPTQHNGRPNGIAPLQNLTNEQQAKGEKVTKRFSFKRFLRLQKRDSI